MMALGSGVGWTSSLARKNHIHTGALAGGDDHPAGTLSGGARNKTNLVGVWNAAQQITPCDVRAGIRGRRVERRVIGHACTLDWLPTCSIDDPRDQTETRERRRDGRCICGKNLARHELTVERRVTRHQYDRRRALLKI